MQDVTNFVQWLQTHPCDRCSLRADAWARNEHSYPLMPRQWWRSAWYKLMDSLPHLPSSCRVLVIGSSPFLEQAGRSQEDGMWIPGRTEKIEEIDCSWTLLTHLLRVANLLGCHPILTSQVLCMPYQGRRLTATQVYSCEPYLNALLYYLQPDLCITLGATVTKQVCDLPRAMSREQIVREQERGYLRLRRELTILHQPSWASSRMVVFDKETARTESFSCPVLMADHPRSILHPGKMEEKREQLLLSWQRIKPLAENILG